MTTHCSPFQPHPFYDSVHLKLWQNDKKYIFWEHLRLKAHVPGSDSQTSCFVGLQKKKLLGNYCKHVYSQKQQNRPTCFPCGTVQNLWKAELSVKGKCF